MTEIYTRSLLDLQCSPAPREEARQRSDIDILTRALPDRRRPEARLSPPLSPALDERSRAHLTRADELGCALAIRTVGGLEPL